MAGSVPTEFIPLAEECGMIEKVGTFVLDTAVKEATSWPDQVRIAVNLSPIQFNNPAIASTVSAILNEHKLRAERLELEITEGVFLPTATRPTKPSPTSRQSACVLHSTISVPATRRSAI